MRSSRIKTIIIIIGFMGGVGSSFAVYYYCYYIKPLQGCIYEFDPASDTQQILDIFKNNWHNLVQGDDYSPEFMMKNRAPDRDPRYFGALQIKVMREGNRVAGFVTYYMQTPQEGAVHLLAVGHDFRGKRYGQGLLEYAIKDLLLMGAQSIGLWVLIDNIPAKKIYKRLGFVEKYFDDIHENVYLEYRLAS